MSVRVVRTFCISVHKRGATSFLAVTRQRTDGCDTAASTDPEYSQRGGRRAYDSREHSAEVFRLRRSRQTGAYRTSKHEDATCARLGRSVKIRLFSSFALASELSVGIKAFRTSIGIASSFGEVRLNLSIGMTQRSDEPADRHTVSPA